TESGFVGYPKDKYTTLPETDDRILATDIATRWIYNSTDLDFESVYTRVKEIILDSFTDHFSHALQHTLYQMGEKVIEAVPEIDEISIYCANKHIHVYDNKRSARENPNEFCNVTDRQYGPNDAIFTRDGVEENKRAGAQIAGFY